MQKVPEQMEGSPAIQLVQSQGWNFKVTDNIRILLEKCPMCSKEDHCYMEIHGPNDEQKQRDGLYLCQRCSASGNLYALKQKLGLIIPGVSSQKEWGNAEKKIDQLPDVEECHSELLK